MKRETREAIVRLIERIDTDNNYNGGLLDRQTIRAKDELTLVLSRDPVEEEGAKDADRHSTEGH